MSFKLPTTTEFMTLQMNHEPTRSYAEEIYNCVKENKPDYTNALEIGAAWGVSTLAILLAGQGHLTSVDIDPNVKALSETAANNLSDRHTFIHSWSQDFWPTAQDVYDVVYIDGGHTYELAHRDIAEGWRKLRPGGLFMVDDYIHKYNKEVDMQAKEPHYGVAIATLEHIYNNQITQIGTASHIWWTIK